RCRSMRLWGELGPAIVVACLAHLALFEAASHAPARRPILARKSGAYRSITYEIEATEAKKPAALAAPTPPPEPTRAKEELPPRPVQAKAAEPASPKASAPQPETANEGRAPAVPDVRAPQRSSDAPPVAPAPKGPADEYGPAPVVPVVGLPPGLGGRP